MTIVAARSSNVQGGAILANGRRVHSTHVLMPTRFRRGERYVYRLTVGEHLLVALHGSRTEPLYALTPTGAMLWEQLESWCTEDTLVDRLVAEYEVQRDAAAADVSEFLEQLSGLGALDRRED